MDGRLSYLLSSYNVCPNFWFVQLAAAFSNTLFTSFRTFGSSFTLYCMLSLTTNMTPLLLFGLLKVEPASTYITFLLKWMVIIGCPPESASPLNNRMSGNEQGTQWWHHLLINHLFKWHGFCHGCTVHGAATGHGRTGPLGCVLVHRHSVVNRRTPMRIQRSQRLCTCKQ